MCYIDWTTILFQLIGRSFCFNLHETSLFEDVCDKNEFRYIYFLILITYQCHQTHIQYNLVYGMVQITGLLIDEFIPKLLSIDELVVKKRTS